MDVLHIDGYGLVRSVTLTALPSAARLSRVFVEATLRDWAIAHLVEEAQLVVSELATNAVKVSTELDTIKVRLVHLESRIVIEVWDSDKTAPIRADASADAENGRGLTIVEALSAQWSYFHALDGGKVVWAELEVPPYPLTAVGLPLRVVTPSRAELEYRPVVKHDPLTLRRVRRGLKRL